MLNFEDTANVGEGRVSGEAWAKITLLLPLPKCKNRKGRPRMSDQAAMAAILYRLKTGCSWKDLPRELGAASTIYDRFQEWRQAGVFEKMRGSGLLDQDEFERV